MMMNHKTGDDEEEQIELPPGFRFHPTDEELITHYLSPKVLNPNFNPIAIGHADLNKSEPWDLPGRAKMGENEWYFFCVKDRKYPTGLRTNRATESGYWKATGKDKEIFSAYKTIVGMKKTLVFYSGRAPKGDKSNWVMHEYRLQSKTPNSSQLVLIKPSKNEWVICRIFNKSSGDKRTHISELVTRNSVALPPLMEYSHSQTPYSGEARAPRVSCFSNIDPLMMDETKPYTNADLLYSFKAHHFSSCSTSTNVPPSLPPPNPPVSVWMAGSGQVMNPKVEISPYDQGFSHGIGMMEEDHHNSSCDDPIDLESLWNY